MGELRELGAPIALGIHASLAVSCFVQVAIRFLLSEYNAQAEGRQDIGKKASRAFEEVAPILTDRSTLKEIADQGIGFPARS